MSNGPRVPKLNPIRALSDGLNYFALFLPGGLETMIALARLSENQKVQAVALQWNSLSRKNRRNTPIDQLCRAAGVGDSKFLGTVTGTAFELGIDVSGVFAAMMNLDAMAAYMHGPLGFKDRARVLHSVGLLAWGNESTVGDELSELQDLPSFEAETIQSTRLLKRWRR